MSVDQRRESTMCPGLAAVMLGANYSMHIQPNAPTQPLRRAQLAERYRRDDLAQAFGVLAALMAALHAYTILVHAQTTDVDGPGRRVQVSLLSLSTTPWSYNEWVE
jgi:hypothetical protein